MISSADLPLAGFRVLDVGTFLAAPFAATILGEFGAEVIKIEKPGEADPLRRFGTPAPSGDSLNWVNESRNKKCITLDLRSAEGADIFRRLVGASHVVVENFRPGTMEKWGLGYERLRKVNPALVMLRLSAYGQTGPNRGRPGFARIAHAFAGLSLLTGEPGRVPVTPGASTLADYVSGLWGAVGILLSLVRQIRSGHGQCIDVALHEGTCRLLDEMVPTYAMYGTVRERMGAETHNLVPHGHFQAGDGRWIAIACSSDKMFARLAPMIGRPEWAAPDAMAAIERRLERRGEVNAAVQAWAGSMPAERVVATCEAHGVPCGILYDVKDMLSNPHYAARKTFVAIADERNGEVVVPAPLPKLSETPGTIRHLGAAVGAHNAEVYEGLLALPPAEIERLKSAGII